jgi:hypothetical protein
MSAEAPADGRQRDNQPNERGTTIGGGSGQWMGGYATTSQIRVAQREVDAQQELFRGGGAGRLQAAAQQEAVTPPITRWHRRQRSRGRGKGMRRGGRDLEREWDGFAAKGSLLRNDIAEIAKELVRE